MSTERISWMTRLATSVNGNPRFRIHFEDGGSAITQSDAGFCYAIENREFRGVDVEVTYTRAGRISDISLTEGEE